MIMYWEFYVRSNYQKCNFTKKLLKTKLKSILIILKGVNNARYQV